MEVPDCLHDIAHFSGTYLLCEKRPQRWPAALTNLSTLHHAILGERRFKRGTTQKLHECLRRLLISGMRTDHGFDNLRNLKLTDNRADIFHIPVGDNFTGWKYGDGILTIAERAAPSATASRTRTFDGIGNT